MDKKSPEQHLEVIKTLLIYGANPYIKSSGQPSTLHRAQFSNDRNVIEAIQNATKQEQPVGPRHPAGPAVVQVTDLRKVKDVIDPLRNTIKVIRKIFGAFNIENFLKVLTDDESALVKL